MCFLFVEISSGSLSISSNRLSLKHTQKSISFRKILHLRLWQESLDGKKEVMLNIEQNNRYSNILVEGSDKDIMQLSLRMIDLQVKQAKYITQPNNILSFPHKAS
jgi:hypothetical protein